MLTERHVEQRLERRPEREPIADLGVTVVASVSIALPLLFYLHQHVQVLRHGYAIEDLERQRVELVDRQRELTVAVADVSSLARVEDEARRLGLEAPRSTDVFVGKGGPSTAEGRKTTAGPARSRP